MTPLLPTAPFRQAKGRAPSGTGTPSLNPNRSVSVTATRDPDLRDEDDELGPWVRLPEGGLEFRG